MLLHGWGATIEKLKPLSENLQHLGWKVFSPKIPGFDGKPPSTAWGLDEYVGYFGEVGKKFFKNNYYFVFGHSFGGRIAIRMVAQELEEVAGIILCSSAGLSRPHLFKRFIFLVAAKFGKLLLIFGPLSKYWRKIIYKLSREHDYERARGVMKEILKKIVMENQSSEVLNIKTPTLILWGETDRMTPVKDAYYLASKITNSKLITYKESGHKLPYEKSLDLAIEIEKWSNSLN